jgi:alkaline phosphatase D
MSCHNPFKKLADGFDGFGVWARIPAIISENKNVRFAILGGDQVYCDDVEATVLHSKDPTEKRLLYLKQYEKYWNNIHYRRVLCSLPAVMMWDDHDITDGWGSREDSFLKRTFTEWWDGTDKKTEFVPAWKELFGAARDTFECMQASRNPPRLSNAAFDCCFRIGRAAFVIADLRSHRNVRLRRMWLPSQLDAIKAWVQRESDKIDTLFFVSPVVFSHGAPEAENFILRIWLYVLRAKSFFSRFPFISYLTEKFDQTLGDLRDDINDAWGADVNKDETERILEYLYSIQNEEKHSIKVVILSGDIHTPGYSTLYSNKHEEAVIPHVVSSPVSYEPFSWIGEAIFRRMTRIVELGNSGSYSAQVSHHFCHRNVVVISLREKNGTTFLKVKYYLEGFPEPQIMFFDLDKGSHREGISWADKAEDRPVAEVASGV